MESREFMICSGRLWMAIMVGTRLLGTTRLPITLCLPSRQEMQTLFVLATTMARLTWPWSLHGSSKTPRRTLTVVIRLAVPPRQASRVVPAK